MSESRHIVDVTTTAEQAREFLERLEIDFEFREQVEANPVAVLAEFGIEISPNALPSPVKLPPPHAIQRVLAVHEEQDLLGTGGDAYLMIWVMHGAFPVLTPGAGDGAG
jgi:hypothetical protein